MSKRLFVGLFGAIAVTLAFTSPASAHVTVNPKSAEQGGYTKLTFRAPNERADASTTKVEITIPTDKPIASVSVQPTAGWTFVTEKAKLATPIKSDDGDQTETVSKITWTAAAGGGIKPGEFNEFNVSAGPLPKDTDKITFKALQTYSNGEVVRWIDEGADAEHPAPVLTLAAAGSSSTTTTVADTATETATVKQSDVDNARSLAIAGLAVGVVALLFAFGALARRKS